MLQELSETAAKQGITEAAQTIVANIKSTMSDRAATQKSFNAVLSSYRADILPSVVTNWGSLSDSERSALCNMHNFYCGMHLVVNMAEHTSEGLKLIEQNHDSTVTHSIHLTSEPGTIRLIRTACKAFERRGDEKSGCPLQFSAYLKKEGYGKNPLIHFRGNRFNIIFANGARIYYLHEQIANFLNLWGTPNRLLQAVLEDVSNTVNIAGCKALGLIDKFITGPFWRFLESDVHVLDIPVQYTKLKKFFDSTTESNVGLFMTGEHIPFDSALVNKDCLWESLTSPSRHDAICGSMLLSLFKTFGLLLERVLDDLQPVTEAEAEQMERVRAETATIPTTNSVSERDFAKFDRLIREKPHASTLALEAHILFTNNKTSKWFHLKSTAEREKLMEEARKNAAHYRKAYQRRLLAIGEEHKRQQEEKVQKRQAAEQKLLAAKEKLTAEIISYGLWQSVEQVDSGLHSITSETQKRAALKVQLRFRKVVLQQEAEDGLYRYSSKEKGQYNSSKLRENLIVLLNKAIDTDLLATGPGARVENSSSLSLTGKRIKHRFEVEGGKKKFFHGNVISQVPGFPEWFNVVYNDEPGIVYSYKLSEDLQNGDLQIL